MPNLETTYYGTLVGIIFLLYLIINQFVWGKNNENPWDDTTLLKVPLMLHLSNATNHQSFVSSFESSMYSKNIETLKLLQRQILTVAATKLFERNVRNQFIRCINSKLDGLLTDFKEEENELQAVSYYCLLDASLPSVNAVKVSTMFPFWNFRFSKFHFFVSILLAIGAVRYYGITIEKIGVVIKDNCEHLKNHACNKIRSFVNENGGPKIQANIETKVSVETQPSSNLIKEEVSPKSVFDPKKWTKFKKQLENERNVNHLSEKKNHFNMNLYDDKFGSNDGPVSDSSTLEQISMKENISELKETKLEESTVKLSKRSSSNKEDSKEDSKPEFDIMTTEGREALKKYCDELKKKENSKNLVSRTELAKKSDKLRKIQKTGKLNFIDELVNPFTSNKEQRNFFKSRKEMELPQNVPTWV